MLVVVQIMNYGVLTTRDYKLLVDSINQTANNECNVYVEIGSHWAGTSRAMILLLEELKRKSTYIGIDLNMLLGHPGRKFIPRDKWQEKISPLQLQYCSPKFIEGASFEISSKIPNELVWVFVDGCHCYGCVKKDIEHYAWRIIKDGYILFHDASEYYYHYKANQRYHGKVENEYGVMRAIEEAEVLKKNFSLITKTIPDHQHARMLGGTYCYKRL